MKTMSSSSSSSSSSSTKTLYLVLATTVAACFLTTMFVDGFLPGTVPSSTCRGFTVCPSSPKMTSSLSMWPSKDDSTNNGEVGTGSNWLEKSFPVDTDGEKMSATAVDDFNIGISGKDFQTGSLSKRMFDTIMSRQNDGNDMSDEIKEAYTLYAMDFTAKEATREALEQNGLDMILKE